ncbi:MAG: polyphosphate kinase 1 [Cyclobacteriaceae bacterium]|nr:polyphosphate kinase 1 [Cyclobacteriaceae bacterium HetDA_MAG_MS6]
MLDRHKEIIEQSDLISRDLSWLTFNYRVLDQAIKQDRNLFDQLKFLAITASNADEFFMIRVGSLYNYLDYGKDRIDYSGLRAEQFKQTLLSEVKQFTGDRETYFVTQLVPKFKDFGFHISSYEALSKKYKDIVKKYFEKTVFPMLTPMVYDSYHSFPILVNNVLTFGVVTRESDKREKKRMSFIQIPQNLPRFLEITEDDNLIFVPIEEVVRAYIHELFKNVTLISCTLFRVTRNGDFTLEESEDIEANVLEEMKKKLKTRKTGRVVRLEVDEKYDKWLLKRLMSRYTIEDENIIKVSWPGLIDYTGLWQIVNHKEFQSHRPTSTDPVPPLSMLDYTEKDMFKILKDRDVLLHQPYNSMDPLLSLIEQAAEDPNVLSIKLTIYRLAKNSRVTAALLDAAENGKHVSVLFEVKARFDEENNMKEAQRLQQAGCFVIYGVGSLKTHTKLLLIVRKEGEKIRRYVHMSSGNYNESTARLYTDIGFLTSDDQYANDVQEFFNVITGHSIPDEYDTLITAPREMRSKLIALIDQEKAFALDKKPSGIVIKLNSLQDKDVIYALYEASKAGVPIRLIVRGICCLRPARKGLSENIEVRSIVGDYLEHSRIFYFHNAGDPIVYSGSADIMVRSFERRLESLFLIRDHFLKQQAINILAYNWKDNVNAYLMNEDGTYSEYHDINGKEFNIHREFYHVDKETILAAQLF